MSDTFLTLRLPHDPDDDPGVVAREIAKENGAEIVGHVGADPNVTVPLDHPVVQTLIGQVEEARAVAESLADLLAVVEDALAQADAETVVLADNFRAVLESQGMDKTLAALVVQGVINSAEPRR